MESYFYIKVGMEADIAALLLSALMLYNNIRLYKMNIRDTLTQLLVLVTGLSVAETIWSVSLLPQTRSGTMLCIAATFLFCALSLAIPLFSHYVMQQLQLTSEKYRIIRLIVIQIPSVIFFFLSLTSQWTHLMFYVAKDSSLDGITAPAMSAFFIYTSLCALNAIVAIFTSVFRARFTKDERLHAVAQKLVVFCILLYVMERLGSFFLNSSVCYSLPMSIALLYLTIQMNTETLLANRESAVIQAAEMDMAMKIQMGMLPKEADASSPEYDLAAYIQPAKEVGGDFYDYYKLDDDHIVLTIADVSGKSTPAAMFMAVSKSILKNSMCALRDPAAVFRQVNQQLEQDNPESMFVTAWLGVVELSTGKMVCVNAGHEYPVIRHKNEKFEIYKDRHGLPLAAMSGVRYRSYELQLTPGDTILVYTDGIPEAKNAAGEFFGIDRLTGILEKAQARPEDILSLVKTEVDYFVQEETQFDDLTMLCFRYNGPSEENGSSVGIV